ncbi:MAG: 50S ribosomal protein L4, partial [Candidatus Levyibacteriota bacterium]
MAKTAKKSVKTVVKKATVAKKAVVKKVAVKKATAKVLSKAAVKTYVAQSGLKVDVFDAKGKVVSSMTLPKELFDMPINKTLMAQAVRVFLGNQRQGTVSTKTRGEVAGSTRKIYRQKGTGRARHGGIRAPIFVKGGIAHGPKPKDYTFSLPVKMRRKALFSALSAKVKEGGIRVVSGLSKIEPKTKPVAELLTAIAAEKVLLVMP